MNLITSIREQLDEVEALLRGYETDDYSYQKEIERLEAENAFLKKVRDRLVCDVVAAAQDYGAPMSDCRICDYARFCERKPSQIEPNWDMCEAAVLKACEEE